MKTEQDLKAQKDSITIAILVAILLLLFIFFYDVGIVAQSLILGLLMFAFTAGILGKSRKIGFGPAFFVTLLLSPLIGLIITLVSPRLKDEEYKEKMLGMAAGTNVRPNADAVIDQLQKLNELRKEGVLTEEEFAIQKEKLLSL